MSAASARVSVMIAWELSPFSIRQGYCEIRLGYWRIRMGYAAPQGRNISRAGKKYFHRRGAKKIHRTGRIPV